MLGTIRLTNAAFVVAELKAPWSFRIPCPRTIAEALMPEAEHIASCHVITDGQCAVKPAEGPAEQLAAGDVVVFPRGDQHVLCDTLHLPPETLTTRDISTIFSVGKGKPLRCGGAGDAASVVSGFLACDLQFSAGILAALPRVMRIRLNDDPRGRWLQNALHFLAQESAHPRAGGSGTVLTKLSELFLAEAVRRYLERAPSSRIGWLAGLRDPHTAKALAMLHERPEHAWTVASLAREVGVARSTLAERFARWVDHSPMQYLKSLRLRLAADCLQYTKTSIGRVAEQAGYDSEAAFTRAFKRQFGLPPMAWRKKKAAAVLYGEYVNCKPAP
jgi:AraC-like DNA-binding protein